MVLREAQSANQYDDRTTAAVKSVLIEIGQILGSFQGKFAVVGGAVPWLLLDNASLPHVGTLDIDLCLDAKALGEGEYASLIESLLAQGYEQRPGLWPFQLVRAVPESQGGPCIQVVIDFLMPRDAEVLKHKPPLIENFAVQRSDGAERALGFYQMLSIEGEMPSGGTHTVRIAVVTIPAVLAIKGFAINNRLKRKDAYDIYYCIREYPGGIDELVEASRRLLDTEAGRMGYGMISEKFRRVGDLGPTLVREFAENSPALSERTAHQWQQDAFGQVDAWLSGLGLR